MPIKIRLGFSSVCAIIGAVALGLDKPLIGGIFIAIAVLIVILTIWLGSKGAA